jgi:alkylation response protein AidB-like acyl-CoA dehydrogenase
MDYLDTPEEAEFRASLRIWLQRNVPAGWRDGQTNEEMGAVRRTWHRKLYEAGYIGMSWPVEYGGRDLSPVYDAILNAEVGTVDSPGVPNVNHLGRAIFTHGSEQQRAQHLPSLLSGEVQWCQGFSEPDAGSDLASLRTRATARNDGSYLVSGQKMWTSGAQWADWCLLLVRTDPAAEKHQGVSCLLMPMNADGIRVRPIVMANGDPETCEMFLDDVRVAGDNLLGDEGDGWRIAMTTVAYERGPGDTGFVATFDRRLRSVEQLVTDLGLRSDPAIRAELAAAFVRGEMLRLNVLEQLSHRIAGGIVGAEGSISRQIYTDGIQRLEHLAVDVAGASAVLDPASEVLHAYLASRPVSIYGGTSQIQRNTIAKRILGMPAR